jgi:regulator of cell morphogenesis and NO signaling
METIETIDVTTLVHSFKNMIILNRLDHLAEGKSLILQNNSDPLPLYYRLLVERGAVFSWEYLKRGPAIWEVKISKLKTEEVSLQISEIVARDYRKVKVLKSFGITVLSGGNKKLETVCQEKNIAIEEVEQALKEVEKEPIPSSIDYNKWDIDFLIDFIVNIHHRYVAEIDPEIHEYMQKVAEVHAAKHFEVIDVTRGFIKISSELKQHLRKEETVLFPYIKKMREAKRSLSELPHPSFGSVANLIQILEREHNNILYEMKEIELSSTDFAIPEDVDAIFRRAYTKLKAFLDELQLHIHLENNILFPKAIEMEKEWIAPQ